MSANFLFNEPVFSKTEGFIKILLIVSWQFVPILKQANGCDYDICSQCMVERCVADNPEKGETFIG